MKNLLYFFLVSFLLSCVGNLNSENQKYPRIKELREIYGKWILISELTDDTLQFTKLELIDTNEQWLKQCDFSDNDLKFKFIRTSPRCGVGLITMDSTFWSYNKKGMVLGFIGHSFDFSFERINRYRQLKSGPNEFILVRTKAIKNESKSTLQLEEF